MSDNPDRLPPLNLLCIDAGGISGLSSLLILKELMDRVKVKDGLDAAPDPHEYFDLMGGTGTGGISVVMFGRLKMSIGNVVASYNRLMLDVYSDKKLSVVGGSEAFKATTLERGIKAIVGQMTGDEGSGMLEKTQDDVRCKVIVLAMSAHNMNGGSPCLFRTYPATSNAMPDCPIWEAVRATMAHPSLFKSFEVGAPGLRERFVEGALGCGNPTSHLLDEAKRVFPGRKVASIVSIGSGHAQTIHIPQSSGLKRALRSGSSVVRALKAAHGMATDNERVADEMAKRFAKTKELYYRLNVNQGLQGVEASEWERLDEVATHTRVYMQQVESSRTIDGTVDAICKRDAVLDTVHIDGHIAPAAPTAVGVKLCPLPTAMFTGRVDPLQMIRSYFTNRTQGRRVFAIHGLGGAGKTQTALKAIEQMSETFSDVIFVDASSRENIEAALASFAAARKIGQKSADTLRWLSTHQQRCMVLFDNADDPDVQLHDFVPQGHECDVLITTRHRDMVRLAEGSHSDYNLSGMNPNEARRLLIKAARSDESALSGDEIGAVESLVQDFECLALAIAQAGAYIWRTNSTFAEYHKMYKDRRRATLEAEGMRPLRVDGYHHTVYSTWSLSYDQLGTNARRLLLLVAFLHREGISKNIFRRAAENIQTYMPAVPLTDNEAQAQREVQTYLGLYLDASGTWSDGLFQAVMSEIVSLSLISYDQVNRAYVLHSLVQDWARAMATDEDFARECTTLVLALSADPRRRAEDYAHHREIELHVNEVLSRGPTPNANSAWQFVVVYNDVKRLKKMEALEIQVVAARKLALGEEHPSTLESITSLAGTYSQQNQLEEAERMFLQVLDAQKRVVGDNQPDTLRTMHALGVVYSKQGRLKKAEALYIQALNARKQVLGGEHADTLRTMHELGIVYTKQGQLKEAEAVFIQVLSARKRVLGEEHPDTLRTMHGLAHTHYHLGQIDAAETLFVQVLNAEKRILGQGHPDTLITMRYLAHIYKRQGKKSKSAALRAQAGALEVARSA